MERKNTQDFLSPDNTEVFFDGKKIIPMEGVISFSSEDGQPYLVNKVFGVVEEEKSGGK